MRMTRCLAMLLAALGATAADAQRRNGVTSAYTSLDLDRCTVLSRVEEGASVTWRCPGLSGVPLFILSGDDRYDIDAGADNRVWESPQEFSSPPSRVEWRLRGGRPFAIIYRLTLSGEGRPTRSVLLVETVGRQGAHGCHIGTVEGSVRNANSVARARADRDASSFRCGVDEADYVIHVAG